MNRNHPSTSTNLVPHSALCIPCSEGPHEISDWKLLSQHRIQCVYFRFLHVGLVRAVKAGRSPLVLTERTIRVGAFASRLTGLVKHIAVLKGAIGAKQRGAIADQLASIPDGEERVLLATGRHVGEGFDDARLDTLFLAMSISWRGTLQQYVGRLHRAHDNKREVIIYH